MIDKIAEECLQAAITETNKKAFSEFKMMYRNIVLKDISVEELKEKFKTKNGRFIDPEVDLLYQAFSIGYVRAKFS